MQNYLNNQLNSDSLQHHIDVLFQCPNTCCEIRPDDPMGPFVVEELVSMALLNLFDYVAIHDVSLRFPPRSASRNAQISISIRAQGAGLVSPVHRSNLDLRVENCLGVALLELFGSLDVKRCTVA